VALGGTPEQSCQFLAPDLDQSELGGITLPYVLHEVEPEAGVPMCGIELARFKPQLLSSSRAAVRLDFDRSRGLDMSAASPE
jgi:hypothetical protein